MIINIFILLIFGVISFWVYRNIHKKGVIWLAKGSLQLGTLIIFIGGFFKLFINLPSNNYIKVIFCLTYIWCTVGINVNFIIPLIGLIDKKIDNN